MQMKLKLILTALLTVIVLAACGSTSKEEGQPIKQKETGDIKELVNDYSTGNKKAQNASITSKELIVTNTNGSETAYDLPKGEFFVSIAPYINQTHP